MNAHVYCASCKQIKSLVGGPGPAPCPGCGAGLDVPVGEDVFISFSFADDAPARLTAQRLSALQIRYWLAPLFSQVGDDFIVDISAALDKAKVVLLLLSARSANSEWVWREVKYALDRGCAIVPVRLESFTLPSPLTFALGSKVMEDAVGRPFAEALEPIVRQVERKLRSASTSWRSLPLVTPAAEAPVPPSALKGVDHSVPDRYVGPRPFHAGDRKRFFGRQEECVRIIEELRGRSVLVLAPSGGGKSSLINTIVRQTLEETGVQVLQAGRLRGDLPRELNDPGRIRNPCAFFAIWGLSNPVIPAPRQTLAEYLADTRPDLETRRVLVLDQFEEIFTHHERDVRAAFFADLKACLSDDSNLRILFAMRQEHQANFESEVETVLDGNLVPFRIRLDGLSDAAACEVITRPVAEYVAFAPGVAEEIVKHLRTRRTVDERGRQVIMRNETIDLVHLQVVCRRLWLSLPDKTIRVEMRHLEQATGHGESFAEFVSHAIEGFVNETVEKVAAATGFSVELITLGLMKFVGVAGERVTLQMDRERTGRLRNDVVEGLEAEHLLRVETRGAVRWYELSHDLLVEPVQRQRVPGLVDMLAALELLTTMMQKARRDNGGSLAGYFKPHAELLRDCEPFQPRKVLFGDETEFLFRSSLALGDQEAIEPWARRLALDDGPTYGAVLGEALAAPAESIRASAVTALALHPVSSLEPEIVRLACEDVSETVREAAATGVARVEDSAVHRGLLARLRDRNGRDRATDAVAVALTEAERSGDRRFPASYDEVALGTRVRVRVASWRHRLRERIVVPLYVVVPAALLSGIGAGLFKWVPTMFDVGITQPKGSLLMGFYQGFVAGATWGALISLALTVHRILTEREGAPASYLRPVSVIPFAIVSGALSGLAVTMVILGVYQMHTLLDMQWIDSETKFPRFSVEFFREIFMKSRFGWAFVISGTFLALGIAFTANAVVGSKEWKAFLARQTQLAGLRQARDMLVEITRLALPSAWPILVLQLLAAPIAAVIQVPQGDAEAGRDGLFVPALTQRACAALKPTDRGTRDSLSLCLHLSESDRIVRHEGIYWNWWGTFAECGCQITGGFGVVVGMAFGIVLTTKGMSIRAAVHRARPRAAA
jgi:hypothetical protein